MGWFSSKTPTENNPAFRDFTGQHIWDIIAAGLDDHGMILRRGTGNLGFHKWEDGKFHLTCEVDPKPAPVLDLITDAGDPIAVKDWNALTQEQRKDFVRTHGARFKVKGE